MVSPAVIAGFAVIDASVIGQALYAIRDYGRHHPTEDAGTQAKKGPNATPRRSERGPLL
jgi:hypothetical protein